MKKITFLLVLSLFLAACSSSKKVIKVDKKPLTKAEQIVENALQYKGVKYKFGGTTVKGMDCSGVVFVAYGKEGIQLPRVSRNMAKQGTKIPLRKAKIGDLLFFKTSKTRNRINHVGIITSVKNNEIRFVHSTTSKGVIESSLSQKYWRNAFVKATSIL